MKIKEQGMCVFMGYHTLNHIVHRFLHHFFIEKNFYLTILIGGKAIEPSRDLVCDDDRELDLKSKVFLHMLKHIFLFGCYAFEIGVWKRVMFKGVALVVVVSKQREGEDYGS